MGTVSYDFTGEVVVVTGAGRGLGRATALTFGTAGAAVAVLDRDEPAAAEVARELRDKGGAALAVGCDVSDPDSVTSAARLVSAELGDPHVLVNNAGVVSFAPLEDVDVAEWDRLIGINLRGQFLCMQAFGRPMLARGSGAIVNVSSISAAAPSLLSGAYSPSKAGVTMLARLAAGEWGARGVRVNAVQPGMMSSSMSAVFDEAAMRGREQAARTAVPLGRVGDVAEVAAVIAFLASDAAAYVSGESIEVDGGLLQSFFRSVPRPGVGGRNGADMSGHGSVVSLDSA